LKVSEINMGEYFKKKVKEWKENRDYYMDMSKKELAIRLALLEDAVNRGPGDETIWHMWRMNIKIFEDSEGAMLGEDKEYSEAGPNGKIIQE